MIITSVLTKVFAKEFYRENAGFFLVALGLAFGFMSGVEHIALAQFFISSPLLMLLPTSIWVLYTAKVIFFNVACIHRPENAFIYESIHLSTVTRIGSISIVLLAQLLPIIAYGFFLLFVCVQNNYFETAPIIIGMLVFLVGVSTIKFYFDLKNNQKEVTPSKVKNWIDSHFLRSFPIMMTEEIMRHQGFSWIGTKFFSCGFLLAVFQLYNTDTYDYRLLAIAATFSFTSNILLFNHLHRVENKSLDFYRSLPIPFYKRVVNVIIPILIITLPEFGVLITRTPDTIPSFLAFQIIIYGFSISIMLYGILFVSDWGFDRIVRIIFFLSIILMVLLLFKTPLLLLAGTLVSCGLYLWCANYYQFEYTRTA